jgi:uncharacterized protein (TIGR03435 family)
VDQTGAKGMLKSMDFSTRLSGGNGGGRGARIQNDVLLGSIECALDPRLGLKPDVQEAPVEIIVIDYAERPSGPVRTDASSSRFLKRHPSVASNR